MKLKLKNDCTDILTIIMMNPSKADYSVTDETIDKVYSFIFEMNLDEESPIKNVGFINILNIFPIYEPDSSELANLLEEVISNNKLIRMQKKNKVAFETEYRILKK